MQKVLVTGANGFIGGHVCEWLKKRGYFVIGLGRRKFAEKDMNDYISCDLGADDLNKKILSHIDQKIDVVVHLAADMRKEPHTVEVVRANCTGTEKLLELCENNNIDTFIQLSSLPVIGKPIEHPITESHPLNPPTVYHVTKRTQELLANYAYNKFGLRTVSFRISAPVGIGMNSKTIFPVFVQNALNNNDIVLAGEGLRKQTYVHVDDISQAIEKAINSNVQGVYNLASYNYLSNFELAQMCIEVLKSNSKIIYSGQDDPMDSYFWDVSLDKIMKDLGYEPQITIETAIKEMGEYLEETL